jgi:hypothetical protein
MLINGVSKSARLDSIECRTRARMSVVLPSLFRIPYAAVDEQHELGVLEQDIKRGQTDLMKLWPRDRPAFLKTATEGRGVLDRSDGVTASATSKLGMAATA